MGKKANRGGAALGAGRSFGPALGAVLFFFAVCLGSSGTVRTTAPLLILLVLAAAFLFWERLRDRLRPPILALALVVLMDLVSCTYAVSGKFALYELLKVVTGFCLALLVLVFPGGDRPERGAAAVLEGFGAFAGLVSIDLMSTRWISTPVMTVLGWFTTDFMNLAVVEEGVRMTSVLIYPNTFATCVGVGVLLGLGLAVSSEKRGERAVHLVCLSVNALAFVLVFSMGGCIMIVPAFLVLLALTGKERRAGMLILMAETLLVTILAAVPISMTSMTAWTGFRPIPLLCAILGAAALCALALLAGRRAMFCPGPKRGWGGWAGWAAMKSWNICWTSAARTRRCAPSTQRTTAGCVRSSPPARKRAPSCLLSPFTPNICPPTHNLMSWRAYPS